MDTCGVLDLETKTANQYLLNPYSGEWIKGLRIVMAEMGLIDFNEKIPRTKDIFEGIGSKEKRRKYIISRLAFVQTFFELSGYKEVQFKRKSNGIEYKGLEIDFFGGPTIYLTFEEELVIFEYSDIQLVLENESFA